MLSVILLGMSSFFIIDGRKIKILRKIFDMKKRRKFVDVYEEYKIRDDKVIIINGEEYFRIIEKSRRGGFELISVPREVFKEEGRILQDELGNIFEAGSPSHCSFREEIPEWYLKTVLLTVKGIGIDKIGQYVRLVKE